MSKAMRSIIEKYFTIDSASILKIGAYDKPTYTKKEANIKFLDIQVKKNLTKDATFHKHDIRKIVNVNSLVQSGNYELHVKDTSDTIIAYNVFGHISNSIKWLITQSKLLNTDAFPFIRIPEYTKIFDKFRNLTNFSLIITDYIRNVPDLDPKHCVESSVYYTLREPQDRPVHERIGLDNIQYWYANQHFGVHCHCYGFASFINRILRSIFLTGLVDVHLVEHAQDTPGSFITVLRNRKSEEQLELTADDFVTN